MYKCGHDNVSRTVVTQMAAQDCFLRPAPAEFLTITARTHNVYVYIHKTLRIYARTIIDMH